MENPTKDFEELFALLNAHHVRAVIVGGYARAFHGRPRYTKDIDIFIDPTPDNAWDGCVPGRYGGQLVFFLGRNEFITNKRAAGRPQDLSDIDDLL